MKDLATLYLNNPDGTFRLDMGGITLGDVIMALHMSVRSALVHSCQFPYMGEKVVDPCAARVC